MSAQSNRKQHYWELQTQSYIQLFVPGRQSPSLEALQTASLNTPGRGSLIPSFIQRANQTLSSPQPPLTIQEQERISHVSWTGTWKRHSNPLLR